MIKTKMTMMMMMMMMMMTDKGIKFFSGALPREAHAAQHHG